MDVFFLDANILVSAAYKEDSRVGRLWDLEDVDLITSAYALEEASRNLSGEDRKRRLERLVESLRIVPETVESKEAHGLLPGDFTLPDDDMPILLAAIQAGASHLLTGDFRDFGPLYERSIRGVLILPPVEYLRRRS